MEIYSEQKLQYCFLLPSRSQTEFLFRLLVPSYKWQILNVFMINRESPLSSSEVEILTGFCIGINLSRYESMFTFRHLFTLTALFISSLAFQYEPFNKKIKLCREMRVQREGRGGEGKEREKREDNLNLPDNVQWWKCRNLRKSFRGTQIWKSYFPVHVLKSPSGLLPSHS